MSPVLQGGSNKGDRSYGKYQVLGANIPSWTKEYYGQSLTPQEFLQNPQAQEAVQRGKMSELWNKYGNINDVASVYFTGVPYAQAVAEGRKDQATGTTVQEYVAKAANAFNAAVQGSSSSSSVANPTVASWITYMQKNPNASITDVPQALRNQVVQGLANSPETTDAKQLETVNKIQDILADPAFNSTFGFQSTLNRMLPGSPQYKLAADINNLTQNLALAARGQLKGQGQVSDFEGKMLRDAQTALKFNMTPEQARQELIKVQGAIRTSSGLTAAVRITDPNTGESQDLNADQAGISKAIAQGFRVQYIAPPQS
jgi:hypothetical protein